MNVILAASGSISVYKAVDLMRLFQKDGHAVSVVLTRNACHFVGPLTFETFCPGRVWSEMFAFGQDPLLHINLAKWGELLLIAPASANIIAKMAHGLADDLLSTLYLAFTGRVVVAPAMNTHMFSHPATAVNIQILKQRGVDVIQPEIGSLACGDEGRGKLPSPEAIYRHCLSPKP
jgi:phosphopantothenoylcysteine decarboxylase / phosphopantothenate---cysteine ligase